MTPDSIIALGKEFRRMRMHGHAEKLGQFYLSQKDGRPTDWSADFVEDWAKRLRVPPYESALEVRPRGSRCECTPDAGSRTKCVWPDGHEACCSACGRGWIELN